jgi:hypothetical protein
MSVGDDGPYILMAQALANTGHIVYNGWGAAMMLLQLYLGAAFIKLFGFSFTTVRMSTLLASVVTALLIQRTLVRVGIQERTATLGTLALVLSPVYLIMSATFMSDITGLLAIVLCLYGCLRALQASTDGSAIAWLCFAVATDVVCGTSRQIAWLGTLVMVPCTLWLLRAQRRIFFAGAAATLAGFTFIFGCIQWLKRQPYAIPVPLLVSHFPLLQALNQIVLLFLDVPFLLLPAFVLFIPEIRKHHPRRIATLGAVLLAYVGIGIRWRFAGRIIHLEPASGDDGGWVGTHGIFEGMGVLGQRPLFMPLWAQVLLTIVCLVALAGLLSCVVRARRDSPRIPAASAISWRHLRVLLVPFSIAYSLLLFATAGTTHYLFDRYMLGLLVVMLPCLLRLYEERVESGFPFASTLAIVIMAAFGIALTHNTFALDRARVAIADEAYAAGIPYSVVDGGWDYNVDVQLQHANHINNPLIKIPANSFTPLPPSPPGSCLINPYPTSPSIRPRFGVSFDPNACGGPAPFAPVHYSRWLSSTPGTIYVVRYTPAAKP